MSTLDAVDAKILQLLGSDGRMTNKQLAAELGVAPSTALERVKRLEQSGVITGYRCEVDPHKLGAHLQVLVSILLNHHTRDSVMSFLNFLNEQEEVLTSFHTGGDYDVVAHVALADTSQLREWIFDTLTNHPEVKGVQTAVVFG